MQELNVGTVCMYLFMYVLILICLLTVPYDGTKSYFIHFLFSKQIQMLTIINQIDTNTVRYGVFGDL